MRVVNANNNQLSGQQGEVITITVNSENTVFGVNYKLGDAPEQTLTQGSDIVFTLTAKTRLVMNLHFVNTSGTGGGYGILIRGGAGGEHAVVTRQAGLEFATEIFDFAVESKDGEEDK